MSPYQSCSCLRKIPESIFKFLKNQYTGKFETKFLYEATHHILVRGDLLFKVSQDEEDNYENFRGPQTSVLFSQCFFPLSCFAATLLKHTIIICYEDFINPTALSYLLPVSTLCKTSQTESPTGD